MAADLDELLHMTATDPCVVGVVLTGSRARAGTATAHSDYDVLLIVTDDAGDRFRPHDSSPLDVAVLTLSQFRTHALAGSGTEWNRYAFTHAQVLKDTGGIAALVTAKGRLSAQEAAALAPAAL